MPLTNVQAKNAKPADKPYKLADGEGMFLLVNPNGSKYWRLKFRIRGKEKLLALGVYPDISIIEARKLREKARDQLRQGIDPGFAKQEQKAVSKLNAENTFEAIAREWHQQKRDGWTESTAADKLNRLEKDVFPSLGDMPVRSITPQQVLGILRKVESRGAQELARRLRQTMSQVFVYARYTGRADQNPTEGLNEALKPMKHGHFAAIDTSELPAFLRALEHNQARLFMPTRLALRLMMLTYVRTSELIEAEWTEFDLDGGMWSIPAERMKRKRPHLVPLARQAVELLRQLQALTGGNRYLFVNQRDHEKPMSNGAILMALNRLGYKGRMTGHGFRALAMSTIKEKLGYRHEVIDLQLAHAKENKVQAAYDRAQFIDDRIKMMQAWADYIDELLGTSNVIAAKFGKAA